MSSYSGVKTDNFTDSTSRTHSNNSHTSHTIIQSNQMLVTLHANDTTQKISLQNKHEHFQNFKIKAHYLLEQGFFS